VQDGKLLITPLMLQYSEFIQPGASARDQFPWLSFTYCSIPFVYMIDGREGIELVTPDNPSLQIDGYSLSHAQSVRIFNRDPTIQKVIVHFKKEDGFQL